MIPDWMNKAADQAEKTYARHKVRLTLGGEPTFVPITPEGPEWHFSAVGPTKLKYAKKMADVLLQGRFKGAARFFCPGKSYPGEVNPRWIIRLLANRDGTPLFHRSRQAKPATTGTIQQFADLICKYLAVPSHWLKLVDPHDAGAEILAMPLDHDGEIWRSARWPLLKKDRRLSEAEGSSGLRLPLHLMPENLPKRVLSIERKGGTLLLFFPPLLQEPFLELLGATNNAARQLSLNQLELHGYTPSDTEGKWTAIGLAADPGVLEINLPPCANWQEYAGWMETVTESAAAVGLRPWKEVPGDFPQGSGGGNHLLWGGPSLEDHPFFTRPKWLARVLRYWQQHPALAYLFTGHYVGNSSQAPRPDESARDLYDIDMAYAFLESLPEGDHRELINETLRHIQIDVTGNSHRSEISFDKFWNPSVPAGALGLVEFRAIEALPRAEWTAAIALLWSCLAAYLLDVQPSKNLARFGTTLLDRYFLPAELWSDLEKILDELQAGGFTLEKKIYRDIWEWRFPQVLHWKNKSAGLTVRKALESWPLLCETPVEGGSTSRFVDTSMQRLEFSADGDFAARFEVYVAGRPMPLQKLADDHFLAGLRYRRTNLYPSLHPGIPPQLPLQITLLNRETGRVAAQFEMSLADLSFQPVAESKAIKLGGRPCRVGRRGDLTYDLRLK